MTARIAQWLKLDDEQGVTAIEYGLIASLVGLAIIVGVGRRHQPRYAVYLDCRPPFAP